MANETIMRFQIADYLGIPGDSDTTYALMGAGFNTLDENPAAQLDTKAYINDKAASSIVKGYQPQFPFDTDLIKSEEAVMEPVSYTHLIYLKIAPSSSLFSIPDKDGFVIFFRSACALALAAWLLPNPVSYTHLDVYKRQIYCFTISVAGVVSMEYSTAGPSGR